MMSGRRMSTQDSTQDSLDREWKLNGQRYHFSRKPRGYYVPEGSNEQLLCPEGPMKEIKIQGDGKDKDDDKMTVESKALMSSQMNTLLGIKVKNLDKYTAAHKHYCEQIGALIDHNRMERKRKEAEKRAAGGKGIKQPVIHPLLRDTLL